MATKGGWHADWWLSCGICGEQEFIEGGDRGNPGSHKQATETAKAKGYVQERRCGWVCGSCAKTSGSERYERMKRSGVL